VARLSHVCTGIVPRHSDFALHERADYGFDRFDRLLAALERIEDTSIRAEVLAALEAEGRNLDVDALAAHYELSPSVADTVRRLAAFGDAAELIHSFGAIHVAQVTAGSTLGHCDVTTFVMASRRDRGIVYWFQDENADSPSDLGIREQPLTLLEAIVLVDATLVAQAPHPVVDGDWSSGFFADPTMGVQVQSRFHPQLHAWYQAAIHEWIESHRGS